MVFSKIAVLGLGKVGRLAAELLHGAGFEVRACDKRKPSGRFDPPFSSLDLADGAVLDNLFNTQEAVLSCLPASLNAGVNEAAHRAGIHYFDLTEDVKTAENVRKLAKTSRGVMAPQCGLAPGFVGIVAASLQAGFDSCRSLRLRVGALPQNPTGLLGYAFNWSPEGVVNEYLNDCEVIEEGKRKWVSPMEWHEILYIDGVRLEAFTTSGGLGTLSESFAGKVDNLDYKTIRYPGHMDLMNFFFHELLMRKRRDIAGEILVNAKPPVEDDLVYMHVSSEGEIEGQMLRKEFVRTYLPREIGNRRRRAIAWTTASSVCSIIELVREGKLPQSGFLKQEEVPLDLFLSTACGRLFE